MKLKLICIIACITISKTGVAVYGGLPTSDAKNPLKNYSANIEKGTASLVWKEGNKLKHFCTAVFLNSKQLLTAAHCLEGIKFSEFKNILIAYGEKQRSDDIRVNKILLNHDYFKMDEASEGNEIFADIALVELSKEVPIEIKPLAIAPFNSSLKDLIFAGYGKTHKKDLPYKRVLHSAPGTIHQENPAQKFLSTRYRDLKTGMCSGDSGGPLIRINEELEIELLGITHGTSNYEGDVSDECKDNRVEGLFTDVRHHSEWIECSLKKDFNSDGKVASEACSETIEDLTTYLPKLSSHLKKECEKMNAGDEYSVEYDPREGTCIPTSQASCEDFGGVWNRRNSICRGL